MPKEFAPYTEREQDIALKAIGFALTKTASKDTPSFVTAMLSSIMLEDFLKHYKEFKTMTREEMKPRIEEAVANARDEGLEDMEAEGELAMEILDNLPEDEEP